MRRRIVKKTDVIGLLKSFNDGVALKQGRKNFVGAIYDTASQDVDCSVALIIGINYGQQETSRSSVDKSEDLVFYEKHARVLGGGKPFQTVLWNFYPYLTKSEWLEDIRNSADEAQRIFDDGYSDPLGAFEQLVRQLDPELIVFHGITSSVPILARIAIRRVGREAILVPNLARGLKRDRIRTIA